MKWHTTLAGRLAAVITVTLAVLLTASTVVNVGTHRRHLEQAVQISAERVSSFAKKTLRAGMQHNRRDEIRSVIAALGAEPGIRRIRVYDKLGTIRYSTDSTEVGRVVNRDADACTMCHGTATSFRRTESHQYLRFYEAPDGSRLMGFINPIANEPSCRDADCHAHESGVRYLGVLDVQMSLRRIDEQMMRGTEGLIISAVLCLLAAVGASILFIYTGVHRRIARLAEGTRQIASGNLAYRLPESGVDELAALARSFNGMADSLNAARNEIHNWSATLERKVDDKTHELAHMQEQILHVEKMASLGKLSSMIAHELNNPLSGILSYAKLDRRRIETKTWDATLRDQIVRDLVLIADEAQRCGDIVRNLLFFARGRGGTMEWADLAEIVERGLLLLRHRLEMQQIAIEKRFPAAGAQVYCDRSHIEQSVVALLVNAVEAMREGGTLRISVSTHERETRLSIADSGVGIPPDDLQRIFEPFFTTKENGFGTGLGLSIVYGIMKQHGGDVVVRSEPGTGSTFTLVFRQPAPERVAAPTEAS